MDHPDTDPFLSIWSLLGGGSRTDARSHFVHSIVEVGDPSLETHHYHAQHSSFDSAVVAEQGILEEFLVRGDHSATHELKGLPTEHSLITQATAGGWLDEHGMRIMDVGRLLESHGVPVHHRNDATFGQLVNELRAGHRIIVGIKAEELWEDSTAHTKPGDPANHALWVTGVRLKEGEVLVVVNDSGHEHGAGREYPVDEFMQAWRASGFHYVATNEAPQAPTAHAANGHSNWDAVKRLVEASSTPSGEQLADDLERLHDGAKGGPHEVQVDIQKIVGALTTLVPIVARYASKAMAARARPRVPADRVQQDALFRRI